MNLKNYFRILVKFTLISLMLFAAGCEKCELKGIKTSALPDGKVGEAYFVKIHLDNTCSPESEYFSLFDGSLPAGIALSDKGIIEGTPALDGDYTFTVKVEVCYTSDGSTYGDCHESTKAFYIKVNP